MCIVCEVFHKMLIGVNSQNEIIEVGAISEGLTIIEVEDDAFGIEDPTQFKIIQTENIQMITPRYPTQGL